MRVVGKFIQEKFLTGEYKSVLVAFNNFINTVTQFPWNHAIPLTPTVVPRLAYHARR